MVHQLCVTGNIGAAKALDVIEVLKQDVPTISLVFTSGYNNLEMAIILDQVWV